MYEIKRVDEKILLDLENKGIVHTIFTTYDWILFLKKNQGIEPVVLELSELGEICCYFVGGMIRKMGIKILGSPFAGWLTCDMGFIQIVKINIVDALLSVRNFAFKNLSVSYIQISDKNIRMEDIGNLYHNSQKLLWIDNSRPTEDILAGFTKNGRRDVRASLRKGADFVKVPFDQKFADTYCEQLEDVFAKQGLVPFYNKQKIYDLIEAFQGNPDRVCALEALYDNKCVASVLSFGLNGWAYYLGAASSREYQKYLPNEGLAWEFMKHWNEKGVPNIDMCGYREYKCKYNPKIIEVPVIIFQKYPFLHLMRKAAYKLIMLLRKIKGAARTVYWK